MVVNAVKALAKPIGPHQGSPGFLSRNSQIGMASACEGLPSWRATEGNGQREGRSKRLLSMLLDGKIPMLIAEDTVKPDQSWPHPFTASSVLSILEVNLSQLAEGKSCSELLHSTQI